MQVTGSRPRVVVTADGRGVVGHVGARLLADVAEVTGLAGRFSEALGPMRQRESGHDPGRVVADVAVMLAGGGEAISDIAVLRDQADLFGKVASDATVWRVLDGVDGAGLPGFGPLVPRRVRWRGLSWPKPALVCPRRKRPAVTCPAW